MKSTPSTLIRTSNCASTRSVYGRSIKMKSREGTYSRICGCDEKFPKTASMGPTLPLRAQLMRNFFCLTLKWSTCGKPGTTYQTCHFEGDDSNAGRVPFTTTTRIRHERHRIPSSMWISRPAILHFTFDHIIIAYLDSIEILSYFMVFALYPLSEDYQHIYVIFVWMIFVCNYVGNFCENADCDAIIRYINFNSSLQC